MNVSSENGHKSIHLNVLNNSKIMRDKKKSDYGFRFSVEICINSAHFGS